MTGKKRKETTPRTGNVLKKMRLVPDAGPPSALPVAVKSRPVAEYCRRLQT
jgi:hypothetical protein